ncbi:hypothetical protein BDZ45DRAFT_739843 [Acephala macrosclerotiorum]|nr:hypothetical protein BDZ45DRAFT_739843 [Acephala macrosclerotiorum]
MASAKLKAFTYRVENIPWGTTKEELVRSYIYIEDEDDICWKNRVLWITPLYVPPKKGPIAADVFAVTGLAGHAYGSWAHADAHMWLREYLPKDAPTARILTYGYPSMLQEGSS